MQEYKFIPYTPQNLKECRKLKEIPQKDLADFCGLSTNMISNYELGYHHPTSKILQKMAKALNVVWSIGG